MTNIDDHATAFHHDHRTTLWQHNATQQVFKVTDLLNWQYRLEIFNGGEWELQGEFTIERIAEIVANPKH